MPNAGGEQGAKQVLPGDDRSEYRSIGTHAADCFAVFLRRWRWLVFAFLLALTAVSIYGVTQLGFNAELRSLFEADAGEMHRLKTLRQQFGGDDDLALVVLHAGEVFSPVGARTIHQLDKRIESVPGVSSVTSLADVVVSSRAEVGFDATLPWPLPRLTWAPSFKLPYPTTQPLLPSFLESAESFDQAKRTAEDHPLVEGWLVSENEAYALLLVYLDPAEGGIQALRPQLRNIHHRIEDCLRDTHLRAYLTGIPPARLTLLDAMKTEQAGFTVAGVVVGAIVVGLIFRRLAPAVSIVVPAVLAPVWTMGLVGLAGGDINPVNAVTPVLVVIIALADGVHLVHAVRAALRRGQTPPDAARTAVRTVGPACFLTSVTTAIGFASLVVARVDVIQYFGLVAAVGVLLGTLAVMTVIPLLCGYVFGDRVGGSRRDETHAHTILPDWVATGFLRYPFAYATVGTIATIASAYLCQSLRPSTSFSGTLPRASEARQGARLADREFGGLLSLTCLVEWAPELSATHPDVVASIRATQRAMAETDDVSYPVSYLDLLSLLPRTEPTPEVGAANLAKLPPSLRARFVREDLRRAVVRARIPDHGAHNHLPVIRNLHGKLHNIEARHAGVHLVLSGPPVAVGENAEKMIRDLVFSLATAAGVIWLFMALAARSWRLGLIIVLPNALPLALTGAWLQLTGQVLTITGVITFCVVLGIAVDDTIHMIHRYKHELARRDGIDEVLKRSFRTVGQAVVVSTAVFVTGLGILLFSDLPGLRMFGQIACVGLVAALFADLLLLPALLKLTTPYLPDAARRPWGAQQG